VGAASLPGIVVDVADRLLFLPHSGRRNYVQPSTAEIVGYNLLIVAAIILALQVLFTIFRRR
jgi:hypothetical protein